MTTHAPSNDSRGCRAPALAALYVLCAGMLMIVLDVTVVNVALPRSRAISAFPGRAWPGGQRLLISFGGLLLLAGRFGDLVGHRRMSWPDSWCSPRRRWSAAGRLAGGSGRRAIRPGLGGAMTSA